MLDVLLAAAVIAGSPCVRIDHQFTGTICAPKTPGKHPAVLLLGGSEGGDSMSAFAPEFARHGYVAASVAYFGAPGTPAVLTAIPVETIGRALAALANRGDVDVARIGIVGISKGGEFALLAASTYPQIKAVVAVVPSPIAYFGLGEGNAPSGCSWSRDNKPLPCVSPDAQAGAAVGAAFMSGSTLTLRDFYEASRTADAKAAQASFFKLERIDGPVLCLAGADDRLWNSAAHCDLAIAELRAKRHPFADRAVIYPNAGHMFLIATRGLKSAMTDVRMGPVTLLFGGTKQGDVNAAAEAWPAIWSFLKSRLLP